MRYPASEKLEIIRTVETSTAGQRPERSAFPRHWLTLRPGLRRARRPGATTEAGLEPHRR